MLVLSAPVGWLADRVGPRRLTIFGVALMAVATPAYAFGHGFYPLLAARSLQGAASAVSWTASLAWLMSVNPPERRGRVLGMATGSGSAGVLLGPVLGGIIASFLGIRAPFVIMGLVAAGLAIIAALSPTPPPSPHDPISLGAVMRRGLASTAIRVAGIVIFLAAVVGGTTETLVPLNLGRHGYSTAGITVMLTCSGVLAVLTNQTVGRLSDSVSKKLIALLACAGTAIGLLALTLMPWELGLAVVFVAMTPAISGLYAVGYPLSAAGADSARLGHSSVFGLINLIWGAGFFAGPAAGAAIASVTSDRVAYVLLIATTLAVGGHVRRLALD